MKKPSMSRETVQPEAFLALGVILVTLLLQLFYYKVAP